MAYDPNMDRDEDRRAVGRNFANAFFVMKAIIVSFCIFQAWNAFKAHDRVFTLTNVLLAIWFTFTTWYILRLGKKRGVY